MNYRPKVTPGGIFFNPNMLKVQKADLKQALTLALPIIAGNMSHMLIQVFDNIMIGQLGAKSLAAATMAGSIFVVPLVFGLGISMAMSSLVAQFRGAGEDDKLQRFATSSLTTGIISGLILMGVCLGIMPFLHHFNPDQELVALAKPYYLLIAISIFPALIFNALKQLADGMEILRPGLWIGMASIGLNVFYNWMFMYGKLGAPEMGLTGAGVGTLLARISMVVMFLVVYRIHPQLKKLLSIKGFLTKIKGAFIVRLLKLGVPTGFQYVFEAGAFAGSSILIGWIGHREMAAHLIALNLASLTYMASMGLSGAGTILVGHAYGAKDPSRMKRHANAVMLLGVLIMVLCSLAFIFFNHQLPLLYIKDVEVQVIAARLMLIAAFFQFSDSIQCIAGGLLRGLEDAKIPTLLILVAYWVIGLPIGYGLAFHTSLGVDGIWYGFVAGLTASASLLTIRFYRHEKLRLTAQ